ncbi:MAG: hypothetical protein M3391_04385 [Actinomycetota bacterium]|nr:hypothetical protein [Actinomycetota bacterium]
MSILLRSAWAAPGSLLGLILAPFFDRRTRREGVLVCEGATWPRRLGWHYRAVTLGRVVLCVDAVDDALFAHELIHVRQWERWGPFFLLAYPTASLVALVTGRHPYRDNRFELAARDLAEP